MRYKIWYSYKLSQYDIEISYKYCFVVVEIETLLVNTRLTISTYINIRSTLGEGKKLPVFINWDVIQTRLNTRRLYIYNLTPVYIRYYVVLGGNRGFFFF
jgi:hypothetical protein